MFQQTTNLKLSAVSRTSKATFGVPPTRTQPVKFQFAKFQKLDIE